MCYAVMELKWAMVAMGTMVS